MAVTDDLRARLQRTAPATSGRLSEADFLRVGATAGALGWGGTQLLAWLDPPSSALLATGLWLVLVAIFSAGTVFHGPESIRFSNVMFVWGAVNGTALALTVFGLAGLVPERVAFWHAWIAAAAIGYCWTGGLLEGAELVTRGRSYLLTGLVALVVFVAGAFAFGAFESVAFLLLGAIHAVPLLLDSRAVAAQS